MSSFEKIFNDNVHLVKWQGFSVSASFELKPFLKRLYEELIRRPADLEAIGETWSKLVSFLQTPDGNNKGNYKIVDHLLWNRDKWDRKGDLSDLPEDLVDAILEKADYFGHIADGDYTKPS